MDKEADSSIRENLSNEAGHKQQVIIVNPNQVTRSVNFTDSASKGSVGSFVERVVRVGRGVFCSDVLPEKIVEERP